MRIQNGWTPLHWPSVSGDEEAMRLLLEHGADVDPKDQVRQQEYHDCSIVHDTFGLLDCCTVQRCCADVHAIERPGEGHYIELGVLG